MSKFCSIPTIMQLYIMSFILHVWLASDMENSVERSGRWARSLWGCTGWKDIFREHCLSKFIVASRKEGSTNSPFALSYFNDKRNGAWAGSLKSAACSVTVEEAFAGNGVVSGLWIPNSASFAASCSVSFVRSFHGVQINSDVTDVDGFGNVTLVFDLCRIAAFTMSY
jgi:hypothetical protein